MTLMRPPKYLALYRRLSNDASGYWAGSENNYDLRMDSLTGCPNEVMLGIAEISALAQWKAQEQSKGHLSMRELVRRADAIEQQLRVYSSPASFAPVDQAPLHPSLPGAAGVDYNAISPILPMSMSSPIPANTTIPFPTENMRRVVARIFREAAVLYLHTVLNEPRPGTYLFFSILKKKQRELIWACYLGVPEIKTSVDAIIQLFGQLPASEVDRSLVFPICLAGCLTDDRGRKELLKARLQAQDENLGNILQARALMETVWRRRDIEGGSIDWRKIMQSDGLNLLLI